MTPEIKRTLAFERAKVRHLLAYEMRTRGYTTAAVAQKIGCTPDNVRQTLVGKNHSTNVLDVLREIGIPEELLFDPRNYTPAKISKITKAV